MPRKLKPFIRNRDADTYAVVPRSRADPLYDDSESSKHVLVPVHLGARPEDAVDLPDDVFESDMMGPDDPNRSGPVMPSGLDGVVNMKSLQAGGAGGPGGVAGLRVIGFGSDATTEHGAKSAEKRLLTSMTEEQLADYLEVRQQLQAGEEDAQALALSLAEQEALQLSHIIDPEERRLRKARLEEITIAQLQKIVQARERDAGVIDGDEAGMADASAWALDDDFVSRAQGGVAPTVYREEFDPNYAEEKGRRDGTLPLPRGGEDLDLDGLEGDSEDDYSASASASASARKQRQPKSGGEALDLDELEDDLPDWSELGTSVKRKDDPESLRSVMDARFERLVGKEYDEAQMGGLEEEEDDDSFESYDDADQHDLENMGAPRMAQFQDIFDEFLDQHASKKTKMSLAEQARLDRERDEMEDGDGEEHEHELRHHRPPDMRRFAARAGDMDEQTKDELKAAILAVEENRALGALDQPLVPVEIPKARQEERWDAETIVSTYSNLDNHPHIVRAPVTKQQQKNRDRRKRKREATIAMDEPEAGDAGANPQIKLSRYGVPLGVLDDASPLKRSRYGDDLDEEMGDEPINLGAKRDRNETPEQRRARKASLKESKREARARKSELKNAFKSEEQLQRRRQTGVPVTAVLKI